MTALCRGDARDDLRPTPRRDLIDDTAALRYEARDGLPPHVWVDGALGRSTMRSAVDGFTASAIATSSIGPRGTSTTMSRNCGSVTVSATAASDRAEIAARTFA